MTPILSICIPTLNRSDLLSVLLENLEQQVGEHLEKIEIVVADNASRDDTESVVKNCKLPIVYGKQNKTVGFAKNLLFATTKLASGSFVWVIGDDDLILPGGLNNILDSIDRAPQVDYHYLNFSWIDYKLRSRIIKEFGGHPSKYWLERLQFKESEWKLLNRLEDLTYIASDNISAVFSGIFCFVTRRQFYIDALDILRPSDSLDGSSTLIDDCFPHSKLALPRVAGKEIAFIGMPCFMQGVSAWEWGAYANKNMIFGTHQFFEWLETTAFAKDALERLWQSYYKMAGKLFFRMLYYRDEHKGLDIVLEKAIPESSKNIVFWDSFMEESKLNMDVDHDARNLSDWVTQLVNENPSARLGLWGIAGRGHRFIKFTPQLLNNLVWIADREVLLSGAEVEGTQLLISETASLINANLDVLVIGTRKQFVAEIIAEASTVLKPEASIVSIQGIYAQK